MSERSSGSPSPGSATGARTSPATSPRCPTARSPGCATRDAEALARIGAQHPGAAHGARPRRGARRRHRRRRRPRHAGPDPRRRSPSACSTPASTASSRSRWRRPSPTPSAPSPPRARAKRLLMVGHLLEYHPGVATLKEIADSGQLGDLHYVYSHRLNLGKLRADENALWSLGAHDVSVLLHLLDGEEPSRGRGARRELHAPAASRTSSSASCASRPAAPRTCTCPGWTRTRSARFTVVGSKRMATFDDMDLERKVTVYDKGFDESTDGYGEYITRSGDIWSPRIPQPRAAAHRVRALRRVHPRRADAALGRRERPARRARARGRRRPRWTRRAASMQASSAVVYPGTVLGEDVVDPGRRRPRQAVAARRRRRSRRW